ncbi:MAG: ferrous iron transport protein A [Bacillota bacterium]
MQWYLVVIVPCIAQFSMIIKERGTKTSLAMGAFIFPFDMGKITLDKLDAGKSGTVAELNTNDQSILRKLMSMEYYPVLH